MSGPDVAGTRIVTLSATYGAGGSIVGPRVAERLGITFLDRLVPPTDAGPAPAPSEHISESERAETPKSRWLWALATLPTVIASAPVPPTSDLDPETALRMNSEEAINELLSRGDVLVLGRAGALVLADRPRAFHVRLDGPAERRIRQAMLIEHIDADAARQRQAETDRLRSLFVRRLYGHDPADPALYHLVVDSTAMALDAVVEVAATAATAFWRAAGC